MALLVLFAEMLGRAPGYSKLLALCAVALLDSFALVNVNARIGLPTDP
jgi:hypothetical protein